MNKLEQAARQALEALDAMLTHMGMDEDEWTKPTFDQARVAITALREALDHSGEATDMVAEQADPVAFRFPRDTESWTGGWTIDYKVIRSVDAEIEDNEFKPCLESVEQVLLALEKVYAAPQPVKQELVGVVEGSGEWGIAGVLVAGVPIGTKLYAAPQPVTTPDVCGEVCARAKLCYGCNKDLEEANAKLAKQAEQEPVMDYERINALREGEQNGAEDAYFFVRPENDTPSLRKMFCQGFERGFHKGLKYAAPVQQVDLTDYEIVRLYAESPMCDSEMIAFARAVIAADREKNK